MKTLVKTTNPVTLNYVQSLLKDSGIESFVMDQHTSIIEGSIGAIPRRLMVSSQDHTAAIQALTLAGLEKEIFRD